MKKSDFLKKAEMLLDETIDDVWAQRALDIINNAGPEEVPLLTFDELPKDIQKRVLDGEVIRAKDEAEFTVNVRAAALEEEYDSALDLSTCIERTEEHIIKMSVVGSSRITKSFLEKLKANGIDEDNLNLLLPECNKGSFTFTCTGGPNIVDIDVVVMGTLSRNELTKKRAKESFIDFFLMPIWDILYTAAKQKYTLELSDDELRRPNRRYTSEGLLRA